MGAGEAVLGSPSGNEPFFLSRPCSAVADSYFKVVQPLSGLSATPIELYVNRAGAPLPTDEADAGADEWIGTPAGTDTPSSSGVEFKVVHPQELEMVPMARRRQDAPQGSDMVHGETEPFGGEAGPCPPSERLLLASKAPVQPRRKRGQKHWMLIK
eukprot:CAMPEP_0171070386 /NCGR_PEP_ID=MMETSP0766_2-20121228/9711_1 /TAXON_ID=439317 /ORGANISM="Gambierdiscus australes, Strain CAWD 149" /LENGTH=155 /DNA_ID=CAMNT_0011526853 /DNA_START=81 /DNA_END=548 /DNA_ORIENTATION=+